MRVSLLTGGRAVAWAGVAFSVAATTLIAGCGNEPTGVGSAGAAPTASVVPADAKSIDDAGVACVGAIQAHYQSESKPLLRDYATTAEGANYITRGYADILKPDGMERYRITCTTTPSGGTYTSTVSDSEQVPYIVPTETAWAAAKPTPTVDMDDAERSFKAELIRADFPGRDNLEDLVRQGKLACLRLDRGDSLAEVADFLDERNPTWTTAQGGQFAGLAVASFCREHGDLLPN